MHKSAGETVRDCERLVLAKAPLLIIAGGGASEGIGMEPITPAQETEVVRLRRDDALVIREIADRVGLSHTSVYNVMRKHGLAGKGQRRKKPQQKKAA